MPIELTRREILLASAGFALAVRPISADTILTDATGLVAGDVTIDAAGQKIPAYRAMREGTRRLPVVIVVHEIFGVHEYIRDVCRRLAKLGFLAVAPNLFARQGDVTKLPDLDTIVSTVVDKVPDAEVMADLDATIEWAEQSAHGDSARAAVTGFCWGGRITWMYCAHNPKLRAGVAWYGRLVGDASPLRPKQPVDIAPTLKVPVLGLYGAADQGIPPDTIERMRTALREGSSPSTIVVYPDAPHGFHADYRPSYRAEAATGGWKRLTEWLRDHGVA